METYKRNQVLEAISTAGGEGPTPNPALKTVVKRLLDTDRRLGRITRSNDPEHASYAFFSSESAGSGFEVLFSPYEAFALRLGVSLLEHRWPQGTAVKILRQVRPYLEPKHAEILSWDPAELFDWQKIKERAHPGDLAVPTTRPVSLVIGSKLGRPVDHAADETREVAVLENGELMPFLRREAGNFVHRDRAHAVGARPAERAGENDAEQTREGQRMISPSIGSQAKPSASLSVLCWPALARPVLLILH